MTCFEVIIIGSIQFVLLLVIVRSHRLLLCSLHHYLALVLTGVVLNCMPKQAKNLPRETYIFHTFYNISSKRIVRLAYDYPRAYSFTYITTNHRS